MRSPGSVRVTGSLADAIRVAVTLDVTPATDGVKKEMRFAFTNLTSIRSVDGRYDLKCVPGAVAGSGSAFPTSGGGGLVWTAKHRKNLQGRCTVCINRCWFHWKTSEVLNCLVGM